jgi:type IV pilus assembly protein PilF
MPLCRSPLKSSADRSKNKYIKGIAMQKNKLLLRIKYVFVGVLLSVFLSSCVTENPNGLIKTVDKKKSLDLHVQMALGYVDKGNRDAARHHLTKAFDIDKNSVPATNAMAMLYQLEGESALAEEQFKKAIKQDKKYTIAHNNYGIFLFNQQRYQEAFTQFELAAADLAFDRRSNVLTNLGRAALKIGNDVRARAAFEHACVLDRRNADAFIEIADINFQKQEYAEAKRNIDVYVGLAEQSPRSLLLSIRLERIFGNRDREASLALILRTKYPYSKEYLDYKQKMGN